MKDSGLDTISQYRMLEQGDRVAVGVSGGADSMALLAFLRENAYRWGLELVVCHVNHGLRGAESDRDEAFVREICAAWAIPCRVLQVDAAAQAKARGLSVEEAARNLRYEFFHREAGQRGKIATAHTASDQLETMLFRLAKGTGLAGLCGIPPVRGRIIRPLIAATRRQVEDYCAQNAIPFVTDSTNLTDENSRCLVRHQVTPVLRRLNPRAEEAAWALARRLADDSACLEALAHSARRRLQGQDGLLDRQGLLALEPALGSRILLALQEEAGARPSARQEALMARLLEQGRGALELAPGVRFVVAGSRVGLEPQAKPARPFCLPLALEGEKQELLLPDGRLFQGKWTKQVQNSEKINNCPLKNVLDYDRIKSTVVVRTRLPGDTVKIAGRGVTKSLKKLFQEAQVPPCQREGRLILADDEGILWVEGLGVCQRALVTEATERIFSISISITITQ